MANSSASVPSPCFSRDACNECQVLRREVKKLTADLRQRKEFIKVTVDVLEDRYAEIHRLKDEKVVLEQRLADQKAMTAMLHQKYHEALKCQQGAFELIQERGKGIEYLAQAGLEKTIAELEKIG